MCPGHTGAINESTCSCQNPPGKEAEKLILGLVVNLHSAVIQVYSLILLLPAGSQTLPRCALEASPGAGLKKRCDWWRGCGMGWIPDAAGQWEQRTSIMCACCQRESCLSSMLQHLFCI